MFYFITEAPKYYFLYTGIKFLAVKRHKTYNFKPFILVSASTGKSQELHKLCKAQVKLVQNINLVSLTFAFSDK